MDDHTPSYTTYTYIDTKLAISIESFFLQITNLGLYRQ